MSQRVVRLCVALSLCAIVPLMGEYNPSIRRDPRIDAFLYRIGARYAVPLPRHMFVQPQKTAEVVRFLEQTDSLDRCGVLSTTERHLLKVIRRRVLSRQSIISWEKPEKDISGHLHCALTGHIEPSYTDSMALFGAGTIGPALKGNIGKLSFYTGIDVSSEFMSDSFWHQSTYQPYEGVPYTLYGRLDSTNMRATHTIRGGVGVTRGPISLETAVDYLKFGPATQSPLTFNGTTPPLTWFRALLDMGVLDYHHVFGLLKSQKDKAKYFYTHRLNIPLRRLPVTIGVNEVVITGSTTDEPLGDTLRPGYYGQEREWEWVYMIPFIPFTFAEQYIGDRDNAAISFDLNLFWPTQFRWYGELFLDDITTPWGLFSDDWGNKWAVTLGGEYYGRWFTKDMMAAVEYTRIEPWVYTHFYGGSHRYTHFGQILGGETGPNSARLSVRLETDLTERHTVSLFVDNIRKGRDRGSDIRHVFQMEEYEFNEGDVYRPPVPDSDTKEFLADPVATTRIGGAYGFNAFGLFSMTVEAVALIEEQGVSAEGAVYGGFFF